MIHQVNIEYTNVLLFMYFRTNNWLLFPGESKSLPRGFAPKNNGDNEDDSQDSGNTSLNF